MKTSNRSIVSKLAVALPLAAVIAGCSSDNNNNDNVIEFPPAAEEPAASGFIQVVHASVDAPAVNVLLNGSVAIEGLDYAETSGFAELDTGSYDIAVEGIIPGGNAAVIEVAGFSIEENARPTVIAVGNVADIAPLVVNESASEPAETEVALTVTHAAPDAPRVDVYLSAPEDDFASLSAAFAFEFGESIDAGVVMAEPVRIRVGLEDDVVYDSGTVDLTAFAGQKLLVTAIAAENSTEAAASPVKLLVTTEQGESVEILDMDTNAGVRVVHLSPDANAAVMSAGVDSGNVEVFATSEVLGMDPVELIAGFNYLDQFPGESAYAGVPAASYVFDVAPDTDMVGDSVFMSGEVALEAGTEYTVVAAGRVLGTPAFGLLPTVDANRAVATEASVKVIHGAPAAGEVDVYVTAAGEFSAMDVEGGMAGAPLLTDFAFGDITDYVTVATGAYDIRVVAGGMVAINVENFELGGGVVASVLAYGPSEQGGTTADFGVVVLTN
ncbi:DUF4397 domain-containing protein [Microbulbifer agarilyticus]|uniref:DUF4397 domain-containing protein n=1 Tax=Microbulbifer agarilyticus TaxID=260552 RepID=UPI001C982A03|nr:DUF4397 domain-containing protein [Microbulbifer agarilyticus]MBY6190837.1 DUF4397 domain-containing protein [Microbulbifer agarilyticus]